jgi:hypothetical protein
MMQELEKRSESLGNCFLSDFPQAKRLSFQFREEMMQEKNSAFSAELSLELTDQHRLTEKTNITISTHSTIKLLLARVVEALEVL